MFDSSLLKRSTAKSSGSSWVPIWPSGLADGSGVGDGVGDGVGEPEGAGAGMTSARYTPSWRVVTKVTLDAPVAPGGRTSTEPSGRVTRTPCEPGVIGMSIGDDGASGSSAAALSPSSSPARLESMIGQATWSGRSESRMSNAKTAVGSASRTPA